MKTNEKLLDIPAHDNEISCLCYCENLDILVTAGEKNKDKEKDNEDDEKKNN